MSTLTIGCTKVQTHTILLKAKVQLELIFFARNVKSIKNKRTLHKTNLLQNRNKIQPHESVLGMPYKEYKAKMRDERAKETEAKQERKHQLTTSARYKLALHFMEYIHKMEQIEIHNIFVE